MVVDAIRLQRFVATLVCTPKGKLRMSTKAISKVLLTGGFQFGGVHAFACALAHGFEVLGYPAEVIPPLTIFRRWRDLRDPSVLKILSTQAVFAAPFARNAICMAHGFPRPDAQGWAKTLGVLLSLKIANWSSSCRLVSVSDYVAVHLRSIYNLRVDAMIHNPVQEVFLQPQIVQEGRHYLTYVGRLVPAKNVHRLLPAMLQMLDFDSRLRICIAGDGPQREELEAMAQGNLRVEFTGNLDSHAIVKQLQKTRVFVSGCETEAFGVAYLEALSQGCIVAMPACGGGMEIDLETIGSQIQLLPLSFDTEAIVAVLRRALSASNVAYDISKYRDGHVASQYIKTGKN
jgi:glycosyltransferase involved in cell wall biosynthesis